MCRANKLGVTRVKVLFHDNCFDGAASAALFQRFYQSRIDAAASFSFAGKAHSTGPVFDDASFDGDVNVVVDFRYSADPRLEWWFDHHVSAFPSAAEEAHYKAHPRPHHYYDPAARSCSKFLADTCAARFGWDYSPHAELVRWADIIDGAQFESPRAAVELAEPALQLMTWVESNHDPALKLRFIDELGQRPLAEIAAEPWVSGPLGPILERHRQSVDIFRARSRLEGGVVFFDVADDGLDAPNKFIPYYLFPQASYVVGVSLSKTRSKVSVGSNPWLPRGRANIAQICERYGGGGHPVVGAVSLKPEELPRAREIAVEIADELRRFVAGGG
jgi:hypothetical protein